jgi:hypothetical protein
MSNENSYVIPLRYRKMENLHIVFWLFKDVSWCMIWKPLGIAMIIPTLAIAIVIAVRTRQYMSEVCHNLAIVFWISANSYWMISEFFEIDEQVISGWFTYLLWVCYRWFIIIYGGGQDIRMRWKRCDYIIRLQFRF